MAGLSLQAGGTDVRSQLILTLHNELQIQETYHNHKEVMAWTATSLYLAFAFLFIVKVQSLTPKDILALFGNWPSAKDILTLIVLALIFCFAMVFLCMQFSMRWNSSDISEIVRKYLFLLELENLTHPQNLLHIRYISVKGHIYPDEIMRDIKKRRPKRTLGLVLKSIPLVFCSGTDPRLKSEIPSYVITSLLFATQVALFFHIRLN
jgi:hypothetical protein